MISITYLIHKTVGLGIPAVPLIIFEMNRSFNAPLDGGGVPFNVGHPCYHENGVSSIEEFISDLTVHTQLASNNC